MFVRHVRQGILGALPGFCFSVNYFHRKTRFGPTLENEAPG
jgi:hypothetical protein